MDKPPRPRIRMGPLGVNYPMPPRDEHHTAAETKKFDEMLKEALNG